MAERARRYVWEVDLQTLPPYRAEVVKVLRAASTVIADLAQGQLTLHAMSLVYTTLLSLVPLLAFSFSVLKGFGVHNQVEPLLQNLLAPLGAQGEEITAQIVSFVDNIKVGVLGAMGLGFLLYTVISLIQKIERAFNHIWHVVQPRDLRERFTHYFSVLVIGPVLVFSALGITASVTGSETVQRLREVEPFGTAFAISSRLVPYLLVVAAFTFVYVFVPNIRVRLRAALVGALVAALLWQSVGWAFASFVVTSTRYTAIYSSFAIVLLFMIWLYVAWLILLVGASVAFYYQHPEFLGAGRHGITLTPRNIEQLALRILYVVGGAHLRGEPPWTGEGLARRLGVPLEPMKPVLDGLRREGILVRTEGSPPGYVPGRDLRRLRVKDVLDAVRGRPTRRTQARDLPPEPAVDSVVDEIDAAVSGALRERSVEELILAVPAEPPGPRAASGLQDAAGGERKRMP